MNKASQVCTVRFNSVVQISNYLSEKISLSTVQNKVYLDGLYKAKKMHNGMDFAAPRGTPVFATGDGKIIRADGRAIGYGKHVKVEHGFGYITVYAHLHKINVRKGQKVKRGDIIGLVGSTGRSEAPHLHYEVQKDDRRINPINFYYGDLSAEEFAQLLAKSKEVNQSLD